MGLLAWLKGKLIPIKKRETIIPQTEKPNLTREELEELDSSLTNFLLPFGWAGKIKSAAKNKVETKEETRKDT